MTSRKEEKGLLVWLSQKKNSQVTRGGVYHVALHILLLNGIILARYDAIQITSKSWSKSNALVSLRGNSLRRAAVSCTGTCQLKKGGNGYLWKKRTCWLVIQIEKSTSSIIED